MAKIDRKCQTKLKKINAFVRQTIVIGSVARRCTLFTLLPVEIVILFMSSRNQCAPEGKPCERSTQIAISHLRS